jgi:cytochrome c-type biogenesis protein CcmE
MKYVLVLLLVLACNGTPTGHAPEKPDLATLDMRIDQLGSVDRDRDLRVTGTVAGPFEVAGDGAGRTITFSLVDGKATVRVIATGVLPDRFREHVTVVIRGRWLGDKLHADDVFVEAPEFPDEPTAPSPSPSP